MAQRVGMEHIGPYAFNGLRFLMGSVSLIPLMMWQRKKSVESGEVQVAKTKKTILIGGCITGLVLFSGASFQQVGLIYTSAGKAGFITGLYVVFVPLLWLLLGKKSSRGTWIGATIILIGLYPLSVTEELSISYGDTLEIAGAFCWAVYVIVVGLYSHRMNPITFSFFIFLSCAILSLLTSLIIETPTIEAVLEVGWPLVFSGVGSVGVAYTLQVIAQKNTHPAHAAIILSLETVFAALGGWLFLNEALSNQEIIGCTIMLFGILISQYFTSCKEISENKCIA